MAKRISLREFQQGLSERLLSARRGDSELTLLGVESGAADLPGGSHWLLDLGDSGEVVPLPQLTPAPLTKPWFAGIANIRGVLYGVVDFAAWRGGAPTPRNAQSRLLLVGARQGIASALLVSRALGLRPQQQLHAASDAGDSTRDDPHPNESNSLEQGSAHWLGGRFLDAQNQIWTQLRISALLTDPDYLDVAL